MQEIVQKFKKYKIRLTTSYAVTEIIPFFLILMSFRIKIGIIK